MVSDGLTLFIARSGNELALTRLTKVSWSSSVIFQCPLSSCADICLTLFSVAVGCSWFFWTDASSSGVFDLWFWMYSSASYSSGKRHSRLPLALASWCQPLLGTTEKNRSLPSVFYRQVECPGANVKLQCLITKFQNDGGMCLAYKRHVNALLSVMTLRGFLVPQKEMAKLIKG